jgi:hypothetical protein
MDGQFFSLDSISSIIGMVAAIMLITQFTKGGADFVFNSACKACGLTTGGVPTKLWVVVLSEFLLFITLFFNGQLLDNVSVFLACINGLVLAGVAMESYNALQSKTIEAPVIVEDAATETLRE